MRFLTATFVILCLSAGLADASHGRPPEKTHYYRLDHMLKRFAYHARIAAAKHSTVIAAR